ncbi:DNA helicase [Tanacetum coccineum]
MEVMPDEEEVALDAIPLVVKSPSIVKWKIHKEGKKSYYQIIRVDGSSKMYSVFSHMLKSFDRKDLETLYKLVKAKYGSTRLVEDLDLVLYGVLKTMFEPHVEDNVWKNQSDYRVLDWKLYDSCGVHSLRKQNVHIHMLVEKRYPFTAPTIIDMLNRKLQADHWNEIHYLDALGICRSLGNPQFFITFTCNVKWPKIKRYMAQYPELTPNDRADIVCRVFDQKVIEFIKFLKEVKTFGYICAVLYTIEFQKRGLPHCHTLLWVDSKSELQDAQHIDEFIFAEILDPVKDSRGYKLVTELMMHRPCGSANSSASCTEDPIKLWIKHWEAMSDDIPAKISKVTRIPNYYVNTAELKGYILYELEAVLNGFGKSIIDFGLPLPPKHLLKDLENKLLMEEKDYKRDLLKQEAAESVPKLNHDKKKVYDIIMGASLANQQELLFLYGHGGTRKTFLWKIVITSLRAEGNDEIGEPDEEDAHDSSWITIPPGYLVTADETWLSQLIDFIYDDTTLRKPTAETFKTYLSNDQAILMGKETSEIELLYPMEYLNTITFPGFLPYELELKAGSPIMLLRNVNLSGGLCNGTRMIVRTLMSKLIEAQIIRSRRVGEKVFLHRIPLTHKDPNLSFTFKRTQFSVKLCYAMTINKSQGQQPEKMSQTTISALKIGLQNCILEARNKAIQANMDINNMDYFDPLFRLHTAYRISYFICKKTKPYHQTLENKISLRFGKITKFEVLTYKESEFPKHHFECIPYNQLASRIPYRDENSKMIYPILTGCIRSISDIISYGDQNTGQKYIRKVEIEDLDGNIVEFTIWDDVAKEFNKQGIEKLTPPIIIAVSSCRVTKYRETEYVYTTFKERYNLSPPLQTSKYYCEDPEQEKMRNRQTLHTLLQQNPMSYKAIRYTYEAMITSVQENRAWKYASCSQCSKGSTQANGKFVVEDILDIQTAVETYNTGTNIVLATSSATTTKESTRKDKSTPGTVLTANLTGTINEPTKKDNQIPGM